jgi:zinc transport system ATP-binding protein
MQMLEAVECPYLAERQLGKLSGGELQRVMLSQAILQDPEIVLLDEPAAGVDFQGDKLCCGLLEKFRKERHFTQIMISHDLATVAAHAAHVICINHRLIAAGHPAEVLTEENLRIAFGRHTPVIKPIAHNEVCSCSNNG